MVRIYRQTGKSEMIQLRINGNKVTACKGESLATVLLIEEGVGYRRNRFGNRRGPVCNMGVCFECSVLVSGRGQVRACITPVEEGLEVYTDVIFQVQSQDYPSLTNENIRDREVYDVAVIGSGPAGLAAIRQLAGKGFKVAVIDEQDLPGGQIYRQPPREFQTAEMNTKGNVLLKETGEWQGIDWIHATQLWGLTPLDQDGYTIVSPEQASLFELSLSGKARGSLLVKRLLLATGAYERMVPFPGWTLPGMMSAGGIQLFIKSQKFIPGEKILLFGTHPFLFVVANQILQAGGHIEGIVFAQDIPNVRELLRFGLHSMGRWGKIRELFTALRAVRDNKVPVHFGMLPAHAAGAEKVEKVIFSSWNGTKELSIACDSAGACFGFVASSELARQAGCNMHFDRQQGGWIAFHDEWMQSSVPPIFVAGEITGVGGAEISELEGELAGIGLLQSLGYEVGELRIRAKQLNVQLASWRRFAKMLGEAATPMPDTLRSIRTDSTLLCRCEEVSVGDIRQAIAMNQFENVNAIKQATRCGMGLCQGRYCENSLLEEISPDLQCKGSGKLNSRQPVKPVLISELL